MLKKLMITGCRKSGNTLMRVLCTFGFENMIELSKEPPIKSVQKIVEDMRMLLDNYWVLFKEPMPDHKTKSEDKISQILTCPNLDVICMQRDPRAVLAPRLSENKAYQYWIPPNRWLEGAKIISTLLEKHSSIISIRYEDLINNPDKIQVEIAKKFNLKFKKSFSQFRRSDNVLCKEDITDLCGIRPISKDRLVIWKNERAREYLNKIFRKHPKVAEKVKEVMKCQNYSG